MSAVLSSIDSITHPQACGDTSHVDAAIRLLSRAREEGERREGALFYVAGLARSIHESLSVDVLETDMNQVIDSLQTAILDAFVRLACERFAPEGGTLTINTSRYKEKYLADWSRDRRRDDFDPREVWADLWNDWGNGQGAHEGYKQAAKAIARFFWIKRNKPIEMVRGNAVLSRSIYVDDFDRKWSNKNRMSYSSRADFDPLCTHFETFSSWSGMPCFAEGYRAMLTRWGSNTEVASRARFALGGHAFAVTYLKQVEFHFAPALVNQLNLFLQTYADMEDQE